MASCSCDCYIYTTIFSEKTNLAWPHTHTQTYNMQLAWVVATGCLKSNQRIFQEISRTHFNKIQVVFTRWWPRAHADRVHPMYFAWPYLVFELSRRVANLWNHSDPVYSVNVASIRKKLKTWLGNNWTASKLYDYDSSISCQLSIIDLLYKKFQK